jgi:hypothetical protein
MTFAADLRWFLTTVSREIVPGTVVALCVHDVANYFFSEEAFHARTDDDPDVQSLIQNELKDLGYFEAGAVARETVALLRHGGTDAGRAVRRINPDLVWDPVHTRVRPVPEAISMAVTASAAAAAAASQGAGSDLDPPDTDSDADSSTDDSLYREDVREDRARVLRRILEDSSLQLDMKPLWPEWPDWEMRTPNPSSSRIDDTEVNYDFGAGLMTTNERCGYLDGLYFVPRGPYAGCVLANLGLWFCGTKRRVIFPNFRTYLKFVVVEECFSRGSSDFF